MGKRFEQEHNLDAIVISEVKIDSKSRHELKKNENAKEQCIELSLKSDSYAVESTIHFPTDIGLLWDSGRKCLDVIDQARKLFNLQGWRKINHWYKKVKKHYRRTANIHQKKGKGYADRLGAATRDYLEICTELSQRVEESLTELESNNDVLALPLAELLRYYYAMLEKHNLYRVRRYRSGRTSHTKRGGDTT